MADLGRDAIYATACRDTAAAALRKAGTATSAIGRPARNASKVRAAAEALLTEAEAQRKVQVEAFEQAKEVLKKATESAQVAKCDCEKREEAAKFQEGPMMQRLTQLLIELRVVVQAFFQHFIGNHCYKMLSKTAYIFDELREVASNVGKSAEFEVFSASAVPLWESLFTVTRLSLAARMLTDEEVETFCNACYKYQRLAYAGDDSNALKRHMYTHLAELIVLGDSV